VSRGGHVRAERWADVAAGRVAPAEAERLLAHADGCPACEAARVRVVAARAALRRVGEAEPPALGWDLLGARVYWSVSSSLRARARERGKRLPRVVPVLAVAALAGTGVAAVFLAAPQRRAAEPPAPGPVATIAPHAPLPAPPPLPTPAPLESAVTLLQGDVNVTSTAVLHAGDTLRTGSGRLAVQFGERSGLLLEPESTVEVVAFDAANVTLRVSGAVTVEVEHRQPGQRFAVLAGARAVEVRGTVFRVAHHNGDGAGVSAADGDLDVAVTRGKVAVVEGSDVVEVPAPMHLAVAAGVRLGTLVPEKVLATASRELADGMHVPLVPAWKGGDALRGSSTMLAVNAAPRTRVVVDGQPVATGSFVLRALPGRHLIEAGSVSRWVDVEAGGAAAVTLPDRQTSERPAQVDAELGRNLAAARRCGEALRKESPGQTGATQIEIGVNTDGSVGFVGVVRPSGDPDVDRCLVDLIRDRFTFPAGTRATVQKVIHF
jgi:outer membrane biosynthesis protein TonB